MKVFKLLVIILAMFISNSYAKKKVTIIEKINNAETIKVFFTGSSVKITQPAASPAVSLYPEEAAALKTKFEKIDYPEDYSAVYSLVVAELNKVFGVEKFVLGNLDELPKKTIKVFGADQEVPDWSLVKDKFIVSATVSVDYNVDGFYTRVEEAINIKSYLSADVNLRFTQIVEEKSPFKYLNPMGVTILVKGEKFKQVGIFTKSEQFVSKVAPNSLVDALKGKITGSLDKFYAKQKKKYDKANK